MFLPHCFELNVAVSHRVSIIVSLYGKQIICNDNSKIVEKMTIHNASGLRHAIMKRVWVCFKLSDIKKLDKWLKSFSWHKSRLPNKSAILTKTFPERSTTTVGKITFEAIETIVKDNLNRYRGFEEDWKKFVRMRSRLKENSCIKKFSDSHCVSHKYPMFIVRRRVRLFSGRVNCVMKWVLLQGQIVLSSPYSSSIDWGTESLGSVNDDCANIDSVLLSPTGLTNTCFHIFFPIFSGKHVWEKGGTLEPS